MMLDNATPVVVSGDDMTASTKTTRKPRGDDGEYISCTEIAEKAGCSARTVRRAIVAGELKGKHTEIGLQQYVVRRADAQEWIALRTRLVPVKPR